MKATASDLRDHLKDLLDAVDRGETVTVVYRGKEKAKLVPIKQASPKADPQNEPQAEQKKPFKSSDHPAFGMWKDREDMKDPSAWVRKIRRSRIRDL